MNALLKCVQEKSLILILIVMFSNSFSYFCIFEEQELNFLKINFSEVIYEGQYKILSPSIVVVNIQSGSSVKTKYGVIEKRIFGAIYSDTILITKDKFNEVIKFDELLIGKTYLIKANLDLKAGKYQLKFGDCNYSTVIYEDGILKDFITKATIYDTSLDEWLNVELEKNKLLSSYLIETADLEKN